MSKRIDVKNILELKFPEQQVDAILQHFDESISKYQETDWEKAISRSGKFVEAALKALSTFCGLPLPRARKFKVGALINELQNLSGNFDDSICLLIPRACAFVYDIASNRGARHDPDEIDSNEMDAAVAVSTISWILSELIRLADKASNDPNTAKGLVAKLTGTKFPFFEDIGGRIYVNAKDLSPLEIGLLILNRLHPDRISKDDLLKQIQRHGKSRNATAIAMTRLKFFIDADVNDEWRIRGNGREKAAKILASIRI